MLATGSLVNYGLNQLSGRGGLEGWRWMFIVQGLCSCVIGLVTYLWMIDFPENAHHSFKFLTPQESAVATSRILKDRGDALIDKFSVAKVLVHALDPKVWVLACLFFLQNLVSTALAYFVPIILVDGLRLLLRRGHHPFGAAVLLVCGPRRHIVLVRRSPEGPRPHHYLQCSLSDHRLWHAWFR